jgi:tRNA dimethylallyltransferase
VIKNVNPLVVLVGPTAVGKTSLAIQLARRLNGEIVSADSRLFYRGLDIGTAKPTSQERSEVPHHLIDVADPDETWSLAVFQEKARQAIADIHGRDRLPILVGGTGQYVRAVVQNWTPPVVQPDARLRQVLSSWAAEIGFLELHRRLAVLDPQAAGQIDPRNVRRTMRALEVIFTTGRTFSEQRSSGSAVYNLLTLGLTRPRPELYARIDERIEKMIADGLVEEVTGLLARGYSPDLPSLSAIGYREIIATLEGKMTLDQAIQEIKRSTRIYVRRQANWFKPADPSIHWFTVEPGVVEALEEEIRGGLKAAR